METKLTYEENQPAEVARFAEMLAEFNRTGIVYTVRRAHGLIELTIHVGAH